MISTVELLLGNYKFDVSTWFYLFYNYLIQKDILYYIMVQKLIIPTQNSQ